MAADRLVRAAAAGAAVLTALSVLWMGLMLFGLLGFCYEPLSHGMFTRVPDCFLVGTRFPLSGLLVSMLLSGALCVAALIVAASALLRRPWAGPLALRGALLGGAGYLAVAAAAPGLRGLLLLPGVLLLLLGGTAALALRGRPQRV
jgi:hypothetical protein